jgi:hypothetical protein
MSLVSKPITPADDSLTCDLSIGLQPAGDSCVESIDGLLADCPSAGDPPSCNQAISTCTPIHSCYNTTGLQPAGDSCVESVDSLLADCPSAGDPPSCNQAISTCTPIYSCYNTTGLQPAGDSCVESVDSLLADCPSAGDPPSCNQAISTCTPIHSRYNTTEQFGINDPSRNHIRPVLAVNIAPYILGPMPPDAFLDRFLPSHSISIPEGTPNFQAGMFTSLLPPTGATSATDAVDATGATGSSGATKPTPYKAMVCTSCIMAQIIFCYYLNFFL